MCDTIKEETTTPTKPTRRHSTIFLIIGFSALGMICILNGYSIFYYVKTKMERHRTLARAQWVETIQESICDVMDSEEMEDVV